MKNSWRVWIVALIATVGAIWLVVPAFAEQRGAKVPDAHKGIGEYKGAQTCSTCHPNAAKEVATSLHYQQAAEPQTVDGWEKGKLAGMMVSY